MILLSFGKWANPVVGGIMWGKAEGAKFTGGICKCLSFLNSAYFIDPSVP